MHKSNTGNPGRRALRQTLLIGISVVALLAVAAPQMLKHAEMTRENHLRENLALLRATLRQYRADHGRNPESLQDLVRAHYLLQVPKDPVIDRNDAWIVTQAPLTDADGAGVVDVHSGAMGQGINGTAYDLW